MPLECRLIQSGDDSCFTSQDGWRFHAFLTFYSNAKYIKLNCTNHNDRTIAERNQDTILTQPYQPWCSPENTSKTHDPGNVCTLL